MHDMGKTIGELHALLIEYEKGLPKKAATPQVMAIQGGRIQKANKKSLNAKGKGLCSKDYYTHSQYGSNQEGYPKETMGYYFYFPPENKIVVARSARIHQARDRLCLNEEVEEYSLGDLNKPANYKAAILDLESNKWVDSMNAEMQSIKDNQVWCLVDLPPNLAKGYTQTYKVDYEEKFSPVADIRAIRILIAIAVFYDYEI
ncbi:hypothetical protein Tco_0085987 [Tanacetum coccineum]